MPYISSPQREKFVPWLCQVPPIGDEGELNFIITKLILYYLPDVVHYADYNAILGVLESVKMELYRRQIAEFEEGKRFANGDVY